MIAWLKELNERERKTLIAAVGVGDRLGRCHGGPP